MQVPAVIVSARVNSRIATICQGQGGEPDRVIHEEAAADQGEQKADEPGKPTWAAGVQLFPEHGAVGQSTTTAEPPPARAVSIDRSPRSARGPPSPSWRRKIGRNCKAARVARTSPKASCSPIIQEMSSTSGSGGSPPLSTPNHSQGEFRRIARADPLVEPYRPLYPTTANSGSRRFGRAWAKTARGPRGRRR